MKNIKLMTLNLWCCFDWNNRIDAIRKFIDEEQPDIIAFQEAQINTHYSDSPSSNLLTDDTYPHHTYEPAWEVTSFMPYDEHSNTRQSHGLAIASKYPIISHEIVRLTLHAGREEPAIALLCTLNIEGVKTHVCNVHFDNTDETSKAHLGELMLHLKKQNIKPIILGDFNIFSLADYSDTFLVDYAISSELSEYMSFPKNDGTLDYIVAPKRYNMHSVVCPETYMSDHRPVIASLKLD